MARKCAPIKHKGAYVSDKKKKVSSKGRESDNDDVSESSNSSNANSIEDDNVSGDNDADNNDNATSDREEDNAKSNDGLADMMKKILNQNVPSTKQPVLAKRKTQLMKDIEIQKDEMARLQKQRKERKTRREKQMVIPVVISMVYEKQLKKLATRGVVALFNAIAKAKKDSIAPPDDDNKVSKVSNGTSKIPSKAKPSIKQITQDNFLQLLNKNDNNRQDNTTNESIKDNSWCVLKDDFFVGNNMTLKDWDKEVSDDDDDNDDDNEKSNSKRKIGDPFVTSDEKSHVSKRNKNI